MVSEEEETSLATFARETVRFPQERQSSGDAIRHDALDRLIGRKERDTLV